MSELDDLRTQNQELKRLLRNALSLLAKSKEALTQKQQTLDPAASKPSGERRRPRKAAAKQRPRPKKHSAS